MRRQQSLEKLETNQEVSKTTTSAKYAFRALMLSRLATEQPPVKRPKLAVESNGTPGQISSAFEAEIKLGSMPEGQETLRKRKFYLA